MLISVPRSPQRLHGGSASLGHVSMHCLSASGSNMQSRDIGTAVYYPKSSSICKSRSHGTTARGVLPSRCGMRPGTEITLKRCNGEKSRTDRYLFDANSGMTKKVKARGQISESHG